ncbi:hypothetical protein [Bacillus safensis]|uniref:hypothetical protein n=1 Tax=Bacillus safensis TaxID=561879 RepID=UPI00364A9797
MSADTTPLVAGAEQYLASLTDTEFADLVNRTRPPADGKAGTTQDTAPPDTSYPAGWTTGGTR